VGSLALLVGAAVVTALLVVNPASVLSPVSVAGVSDPGLGVLPGPAGVTDTGYRSDRGVFVRALAHPIWSKILAALPWIWLAGAASILCSAAVGVCGTQRLRAGCRIETSGAIADCCRRLSQSLMLSQQVAVGVCDRICLPVLVGITRPLILLPASAVSGWSPEQVEMILLHELFHVRRWDNLVMLVQRGVEAVLFFHPAVWSVSRWIEQEREFCCDDLVLRWSGRPCEYAETLVALADQYRRARQPAIVSSLGRPPVVARVRRILFREEEPMQASRLAFGTMVGGVAAMGVLLASVSGGRVESGDLRVQSGESTLPAVAVDKAANEAPLPTIQTRPVVAPPSAPPAIPPEFRNRRGFSDQIIVVAPGSPAGGMRSWGPEQAIGEPNTPEAGDQVTAWASRTPDEQEEWLICEYAEAVSPTTIVVHETYNPGAVFKIMTLDGEGNETLAWEGEDPTPRDEPKGISIFPVKLDAPTKRIKVYIDSVAVPGWNEIDAVGLRTADDGTLWATKVECSTTYAEPNVVASGSRSYGPEQAAGEPNVPEAGDSGSAWASLSSDGQPEWLVCEYETAVVPSAIAIHENYAPGAVNKVSVFKADGEEVIVWEGEDPTPRTEPMGISVIPVDIDFPTQKVKIYIDSVTVSGWNEIDAVGLRDKDGQSQWATKVEASSTYADVSSGFSSIEYVTVPQVQLMQLQQQVEQLQQQVQDLQQMRNELREIRDLLKEQAKK
jgi:beta-lactamase regulating signal transducer with metallopeptidase domain